MQIHIRPAGDSAVLVQLGERVDPNINRQVHALAEIIAVNSIPGVLETVPGYATLLVHYDPLVLSYAQLVDWLERVKQEDAAPNRKSRLIEIPVVYGGVFGPDLSFVAKTNGLSEEDVIRIHTSRDYTVYLMGFMPGFPYLGGMDPAIAAPRMQTPRKLVPAGSVGIAGEQTGVYPFDSPGGWQIIGRTNRKLFDVTQCPPCLLSPGDTIRFIHAEDGGD